MFPEHLHSCYTVEAGWNVMAHTQKPDFVFRRNGRVHLNRWGRQFSQLLAAEVCASAVVMLDTPRSKVVWRVLATHSIRQFHLHFPSRASPCAITFHLESNMLHCDCKLNLIILHTYKSWGCQGDNSINFFRAHSRVRTWRFSYVSGASFVPIFRVCW